MRFDRICGVAAAMVLAAGGMTCASAQSDTAASPAAGDGVIHLHMPGAATAAPVPAAPAGGDTIHLHPIHLHAPGAASPDTDSGTTEPVTAAPSAAPATGKAAHAGARSGKTTIPFNFGEDDAVPPADGGPYPGAPAPVQPKPQPAVRTASIPPHAGSISHAAGSNGEHAALTKRGAVMFEKGATDPSPAQFSGVKILAGDLSAALESGSSRIQLEAYGGAPGDKSSDARRLSLRRALAVRQLLIDNGVPSNRIDVRAMGGVDDKGPADRVDVFLRAA
jgi:outer membrane protein OmpA-like peptidoglycan-associated protein